MKRLLLIPLLLLPLVGYTQAIFNITQNNNNFSISPGQTALITYTTHNNTRINFTYMQYRLPFWSTPYKGTTCTAQLAAQQTCQYVMKTTIPQTLSQKAIHLPSLFACGQAGRLCSTSGTTNLNITEQSPLTLQANLIGLNDNTEKDITYPVTLTLLNNNQEIMATGITIKAETPEGFTSIDNNYTHTLDPGASCQIYGTSSPQRLGINRFHYNITYHEGKPITLERQTGVTNVAVQYPITKGLDTYSEKTDTHRVVFTFTNPNKILPATQLHFTKTYPPGFTQDSDNCSTRTQLDPRQSCEITGHFKSVQLGRAAISVDVSYKEERRRSGYPCTNVNHRHGCCGTGRKNHAVAR